PAELGRAGERRITRAGGRGARCARVTGERPRRVGRTGRVREAGGAAPMTTLVARAKINLALVVGSVDGAGKHEGTTVLQRLRLAAGTPLEPGAQLRVEGFPQDTLVTRALTLLAETAGVSPAWSATIEKEIPVAAGLGGGSADAAAALRLANDTLDAPLSGA